MAACGKDEPGIEQPGVDNPSAPIGPNETVSDPTGTVALSMRNENSGKTYLDNIYIDKGDNFAGGQFVGLGAMKGLGNVSYIPKSGYASKVAVNRGNGYIAYAGGKFYRIYVTDYILDVAAQILGAEVKYQKPFYGIDEPLRVDETALTFTSDGGSQPIVFNNSTIIPFTIQSSAPWCRVYASSTTDSYFLHDAVTIEVDPTSSAVTEEAVVTLTTGYKKELTIRVVRAGSEPYVSMSKSSAEISYDEQTVNVGISTNLSSDLKVSSDAEWCTAVITDKTSRMIEKSALIKYVDGKPATASRAYGDGISSLNLAISATKNISEIQRTATITLTAGSVTETFTLLQNGTGITLPGMTDNSITMGAKASTLSWTVQTELGLDELELSTDADWLTLGTKYEGYDKKIVMTATSNDNTLSRKAKVTVSSIGGELSTSFNLIQESGTLEFVTDEEYISVPSTAGSQTIQLNTTVPSENLQVESSEDWCKASISGTSVKLDFSANPSSNSREAIIKVSSSEGNIEQSVRIKQEDGYIRFTDEKLEIDAFGGSRTLEIETNLDMSTFEVKSDCEWVSVTKSEKVLTVTVEPNKVLKQRESHVLVSSPDNKISAKLPVIQTKAVMYINQKVVEDVFTTFLTKQAATLNYTITTTLDWEVESDASWCQVYKSGISTLALIVDATTENRKVTVSFKDLPFRIEVSQLKYDYYDSYSENGITGTICYLGEQYGVIYKDLGQYQWATDLASWMLTGANSMTDGQANMDVISSIPNWKELFPAFAACDALNVNNVSGWYIPSPEEARSMLWFGDNRFYWTSRETSASTAAEWYYYHSYESDSEVKTKKRTVIALHKFYYD